MFQEQENKRQNLQNYANFLEEIRAFMKHRGICEVNTNPLVKAVVPDAGVDPVGVDLQIGKRFLHTSPEWEMKKLLAEGAGSIYQMASVFRDDQNQNWHKPAFMMLEWYELGINDQDLIQQCLSLLATVGVKEDPCILTMQDLYQQYCGITFEDMDVKTLKLYCHAEGIDASGLQKKEETSSWLDLIWVTKIEPGLKGLVVVKDFHPSQSALAEVVSEPYPHAKRFEILLNGCELANGYHETTDLGVLEERFHSAKSHVPIVDVRDIKNMPACAGVSVGIDRLFAQIKGLRSLF